MTASWSFSGMRSTRPVAVISASASARCASSQCGRGDRGHPLVDQGRRVRHHPHDSRSLGQARLDDRRGDARGEGDDQLTRADDRPDLVEHVAMSCGFTTSVKVSAFEGHRVVEDVDAVLLAELGGSLAALSPTIMSTTSHRHAAAPTAGLPHHPGTEHGDRGRHHCLRLGRPPLGDHRPAEECQVGRTLRQTSHQVAVPLLAVRDVDPHRLTGAARRRCSSGRMP